MDHETLCKAVYVLQDWYYLACRMDLDEALTSGINSRTMMSYHMISLQQRADDSIEHGGPSLALLACFGGYDPMRTRCLEIPFRFKGEHIMIQ